MHYVYKIYNNYGSVVYVGETKRPEARKMEQVGRNKSPFSGLAFTIVQTCETKKEALAIEDALKLEYGLERHEYNRNQKARNHASELGKRNYKWLLEHQKNAGQRAKENGSVEKMIEAARIANTGRPNKKLQRLTSEQALEIKKLYATGNYTQRQLGEIFGVSQYPIRLIVNNKDIKQRK